MIAFKTPRRTVAQVSRRMELAKALKIAHPTMSNAMIGEQIGASGHMVGFYLRGKIKRFSSRPHWAEKFFAAAAQLSQGDEGSAAVTLRALAEQLISRQQRP